MLQIRRSAPKATKAAATCVEATHSFGRIRHRCWSKPQVCSICTQGRPTRPESRRIRPAWGPSRPTSAVIWRPGLVKPALIWPGPAALDGFRPDRRATLVKRGRSWLELGLNLACMCSESANIRPMSARLGPTRPYFGRTPPRFGRAGWHMVEATPQLLAETVAVLCNGLPSAFPA